MDASASQVLNSFIAEGLADGGANLVEVYPDHLEKVGSRRDVTDDRGEGGGNVISAGQQTGDLIRQKSSTLR